MFEAYKYESLTHKKGGGILKQKHFRAMQKTLKNNLSSSPSRVAAPVQPLLPFSSPLSRDLTLSSAKASPPLAYRSTPLSAS
jgi:hypothetical protein